MNSETGGLCLAFQTTLACQRASTCPTGDDDSCYKRANQPIYRLVGGSAANSSSEAVGGRWWLTTAPVFGELRLAGRLPHHHPDPPSAISTRAFMTRSSWTVAVLTRASHSVVVIWTLNCLWLGPLGAESIHYLTRRFSFDRKWKTLHLAWIKMQR